MVTAFLDGLMRVKRAPWLVIGLWLSTLLLALPLSLALHALIGEHLGQSMAAQAAAAGVNFDWWNEFLAQSSGVGNTFVPAILGFAAILQARAQGQGVILVAGHFGNYDVIRAHLAARGHPIGALFNPRPKMKQTEKFLTKIFLLV